MASPAHTETGKLPPGTIDPQVADRALRRVRDYLSTHPEQDELHVMVPETGPADALVIPRPLVEMFGIVLAALAQGNGVQVTPLHAELTTFEAAEMLGVSRPYLIKLLDAEKIPYRRVGRHRRIRLEDLVRYKRLDDSQRAEVLDELSRLGQELDI